MARLAGETAKPEDTSTGVTAVERVKGGCRDMRQAPDADIGPPEAQRQYTGERLKPVHSWNKHRPRAPGYRK